MELDLYKSTDDTVARLRQTRFFRPRRCRKQTSSIKAKIERGFLWWKILANCVTCSESVYWTQWHIFYGNLC